MKTLKILLITAFAFVASAATASTEFNQFDQERIAVHDDQCSMDVVAVVESSAYVMSAKTLHSLETAEEITFESFDVYTVSIMGVPQHPELIHRHLATNYSMFKISNANQKDPNEPKGEVIPDLDFWGCSVPWNVVDKILGKFD